MDFLAGHRTENEINKLLSKYKYENKIHEYKKQ